ncbi:hypothetical protein K9L05_01440 [Candidatus Babeliales bacterium]|nr:hypothetical protein [Candidatus Babeliales bacterium]
MKILGFYSKIVMSILGLAIFNGLVGMENYTPEEISMGFGSGSSSTSSSSGSLEPIQEDSDSEVLFDIDQMPRKEFIEQAYMISEDIRQAYLQSKDAIELLPGLAKDTKECLRHIKSIDGDIQATLKKVETVSKDEVKAGKNFERIKNHILYSPIKEALEMQQDAVARMKMVTDARSFLIERFNQLKIQKSKANALFEQAMSRLQTAERTVTMKTQESGEVANRVLEPLDPSILDLNELKVDGLGLMSRHHLENSKLENITGKLYFVAQEAKALFDGITEILNDTEKLSTIIESRINDMDCFYLNISNNVQIIDSTPRRVYFEHQDLEQQRRDEERRKIREDQAEAQKELEDARALLAQYQEKEKTEQERKNRPNIFSRALGKLIGRKRTQTQRDS